MKFAPQQRLLASALIDSLGSGLVAPFSLLFGHVVVGLSLPVTGLAASIASGVAMAAGPVAGSLVDRHGAARVAAAGNVLAAVGGIGLLLSREVIVFTLASLVCAAAQRTFWAAFSPLVAETVRPRAPRALVRAYPGLAVSRHHDRRCAGRSGAAARPDQRTAADHRRRRRHLCHRGRVALQHEEDGHTSVH